MLCIIEKVKGIRSQANSNREWWRPKGLINIQNNLKFKSVNVRQFQTNPTNSIQQQRMHVNTTAKNGILFICSDVVRNMPFLLLFEHFENISQPLIVVLACCMFVCMCECLSCKFRLHSNESV